MSRFSPGRVKIFLNSAFGSSSPDGYHHASRLQPLSKRALEAPYFRKRRFARMASSSQQNLATHVRFDPLYHFFALPVVGLTVVVAIVHAVQRPNWFSAW